MRATRQLALVLLSLALPASTRAADLPDVQSRGVLRALVILDDEKEFFSGQPGQSPGFDHELLEGFARLQRVKLELVPAPSWDDLVPHLVQGKGDLIAGRFTVTESRRQLIDFTAEVFPTRYVVVTRRPHRAVRSLEELRQEKISVIKGTSMVELLQSLGVPAASLDFSIPTGGIPTALRTGRITCTIHDAPTAVVAQRKDPEIQLGLFLGPPSSYAYGVRKSDAQLLKELNAYLANVRRSPTWSRLVVKYFGQAALDVLQKARAE